MRFGAKFDDSERQSIAESEKLRKLKEKMFAEKSPTQKYLLITIGVAAFLFMMFLSGYIVNIQRCKEMDMNIVEAVQLPAWRHFLAALTSLSGWIYTIIGMALVFGILYLLGRKNKDLEHIKSRDDRGVDYSEDGTYGTAEWMTRKEAEKTYEIGHIDKVEGVILGQYTEGGKEAICLPKDTSGNRNILILGSPGTGKSFCYVRNAIFQAIVRGESVVITDPKGELYESTSEKLRQEGYKVRVFNLVTATRSDAWNCMSEIYDPETGDVSELRVTEFADTLMKNTCDGPDDHFWGTGESNLLKAIIMFCAWRRESDLIALYESEGRALLKQVGHMLDPDDSQRIMDIISNKRVHHTMNEREHAMRILIKLAEGEEYVDEHMKRLQLSAPMCNIGEMYYLLVTTDISSLGDKFKAVPTSHPAGIAWGIFTNGADNVRPGIVQGLAQRLQLFQMQDIRRITTNDDIVLEKLGEEKTALFCIISDKSTAMRALTSLFFTFLFKDVADAADRYGPENRLPVNVICDEFANLGTIPSFDVTISTVRSRRINISIILQSVMQLEKNYAEARETIISCCDTILFLGCNDTETANFISELSGVASIRVSSTADTRNTSIGNRTVMQGYKLSEGDGKRNLMNPDEVRRLPREDVIIYHNGCNILQAHRCGYIEHKFFREGLPPAVRLRDYPLASEKYSVTEELDAFILGDVANLKAKNTAIVTEQQLDRSKERMSRPIDKDVQRQMKKLNATDDGNDIDGIKLEPVSDGRAFSGMFSKK